MKLYVRCSAAPFENTTVFDDEDRAVALATELAEEYNCDVDITYYKGDHRQCWLTVSPPRIPTGICPSPGSYYYE